MLVGLYWIRFEQTRVCEPIGFECDSLMFTTTINEILFIYILYNIYKMSYNDLKQSLTKLYYSYMPQKVETFVVDMFPPFPSMLADADYQKNLPVMLDQAMMGAKQAGLPLEYANAMANIARQIRPSELYFAVVNFDLHPRQLDEANKNIRIKYLKLFKAAIQLSDKYLSPVVKAQMAKNLEPGRQVVRLSDGRMVEQATSVDPLQLFVFKNFDSGRDMLIRLIDLLILEANPVVCAECWAKSKGEAVDLIQNFRAQNRAIKSSKNESFCVDVPGGTTNSVYPIQIFSCNNSPAQRWTYQNGLLVNPNSNKCLDVQGAGKTNGTPIGIYDCNPSAKNQQWVYDYNTQALQSAHAPGMCLDINGGNFANGTNLQLYQCNKTDAQRWTL